MLNELHPNFRVHFDDDGWGSSSPFSYWKSSVSPFLCLLFSGAKPYRWRILRHLKTTVLLVYHSTFFLLLFFQDLLQTRGSVFLASGLLNCGRKYKKSFPAIGQYGHVLSLKDTRSLSQGYQCTPSKGKISRPHGKSWPSHSPTDELVYGGYISLRRQCPP